MAASAITAVPAKEKTPIPPVDREKVRYYSANLALNALYNHQHNYELNFHFIL